MSLSMDPGAPPRREIQGIVLRQLDEAHDKLCAILDPHQEVDLKRTVHDVRKRCKEVRALARLARPALGDDFKEFNALVRDAAAELGALRDAQAVLGTVEVLVRGQPAESLVRVRDAIAKAADDKTATTLATPHLIEHVLDGICDARHLAAHWRFPKGFTFLADGAAITYAQGRRNVRAARKQRNDDTLHEYRKTAKHLWYQLRFLRPLAPTQLGPTVKLLDGLADALGDDHDLAVLTETITAAPASFGGEEVVAEVVTLVNQHRKRLQKRSIRLGETIYAERPAAFAARLTAYWQLATRRGPEKTVAGLATLMPSTVGSDHFERERKWLIAEAPADLGSGTALRQGYLLADEAVSIRVRDASAAGCTVTIKSGAGATRTELEWSIDLEVFERLWPLTEGRRVAKTRHHLPAGEHIIELDVFGGALEGLLLAEVEFDSDNLMHAYEPPDWFGDEVTEVGGFTNASLARHGLPT